MDAAVIVALISALFAGGGIKLVERWLDRSKIRQNLAADIRDELREDNITLRTRNDKLESDVEYWRSKYYEVIGQMVTLSNTTTRMLEQRDIEVDDETET